VDVLHGSHSDRLLRASAAPDEVFHGPFKLNNLFAESESVRRAIYDPQLRTTLHHLLGSDPMAINSLNFVCGSQQPAHIDTWYMPPPAGGQLIVASICLEDVHESAGPLFYYPGSHRIPPYRFSHGGIHAVASEMADCNAHLQAYIESRGLRQATFCGRKGDVFVWHAQLLHGGSAILEPERTRRSLVVHYWNVDSVPAGHVRSFGKNEYCLDRDYFALPT
jgi:ectoine hydroxylase-related dioxygenase (phytanoyl-CoA dioxygenase family)